jgi:hypothetical protein
MIRLSMFVALAALAAPVAAQQMIDTEAQAEFAALAAACAAAPAAGGAALVMTGVKAETVKAVDGTASLTAVSQEAATVNVGSGGGMPAACVAYVRALAERDAPPAD